MWDRVWGRMILLVLGLWLAGPAWAESPSPSPAPLPRIEQFTPQGEAKTVRQAIARFSTAMVPFGDPHPSDPFEIQCAEPGQGRWLDDRTYSFDFVRDLPAGVQCAFTLKSGLRTLAGVALGGEPRFSFSTGGPSIQRVSPDDGEDSIVEEGQIFAMVLDAPVPATSIREHVYCGMEGIAEQIGVELLGDAERTALFTHGKASFESLFRALAEEGDSPEIRRKKVGEELKKGQGVPTRLLALRCQRPFPNDAKVRLVWGKGVAAASGIATTQDRVLSYRARGAFTARFSCQRIRKESQCIPLLPMRLEFSAPIARADAARIALKSATGTVFKTVLDNGEGEGGTAPTVDAVRFDGPFPPKGRFTLEIPASLKDDSGRALTDPGRFPLTVETDEDPPLAKFPAPFGIIEMAGGAALPVTVRNLEAHPTVPPGAGPEVPPPSAPVAVSTQAQAVAQGKPPAGTGAPAATLSPTVATPAAPVAPAATPAVAATPALAAAPAAAEIRGRILRVDAVEEYLTWMDRVQQSGQSEWRYDEEEKRSVLVRQAGERPLFDPHQVTREFVLPRTTEPRAFEVLGIPFDRPGFYVVELVSPRLGAFLLEKQTPYFAQTVALVTNLAVHFKQGRESSLVWVTRLDRGEPVAGAEIAVRDCSGKVHWQGKSDAQGIARIALSLTQRNALPDCPGRGREYLISARQGEDVSFVLSGWDKGIDLWRFNLPTNPPDLYRKPLLAATVFDRTLLRVGETVHMKHFFRRQTATGFTLAAGEALPKIVRIQREGADEKYEFPLAWGESGIAETIWAIPKEAKQGKYSVVLDEHSAGGFRVESFRVPTMQAILKPVGTTLIGADRAELDLQVNYLAGGGAAHAPVKLRGILQAKKVAFPDYEGFVFANGDVRVGMEAPGAEGEGDDGDGAESGEGGNSASGANLLLAPQSLTLDGVGAARVTLAALPRADSPKDLLAEAEFRDANGEIATAAVHVPLWPAAVLLGLKPDGWVASKDGLRVRTVAVDPEGRPLAGIPVRIDLLERKVYSHRKRLIGGFYAYHHQREVKAHGELCHGITDEKGRFFCEGRSPVGGNVILRAEAKDSAGRLSHTNREMWIANGDDWWFEAGNEDRMDLIPERPRYEPGETARFQVRSPFRTATALVTVEREGVLEARVEQLSGQSPVIQVPLQGHHAPNVFVSVLAVRGRVAEVQPTALVDLGKPAFKMGLAEVKVGWAAHELKVSVHADQAVYPVRGKAVVQVKVVTGDGRPLSGGEIALAAVDEGLLELMPNTSWDLLPAMMTRRPVEVATATAQMQVVGKRHFGRKAQPHGGGGGRQATRELFDTLLSWQGRVRLDPQGEARVEVPLNDSLSSFRIVAVASAGEDRFGTGQTSIRTAKEIMLFSGLPPLVREQDRYRAEVTVRNAATRPLEVQVMARLSPGAGGGKVALGEPLAPQQVHLAAGEARAVGWEVTVPKGLDHLVWEVSAEEHGPGQGPGVSQGQGPGSGPGGKPAAPLADALRVEQKVARAVPVRTFQALLVQLDGALDLPVAPPAEALPERGGIRLDLRPRLADGLGGVHEYMRFYPYSCLEQRVSRAVALRDLPAWEGIAADLPTYLDEAGLTKFFPSMGQGSEILTAYVLRIADEAGWSLPAASRDRMRDGLRGIVTGKVVRPSFRKAADLPLRKLAALAALARLGTMEAAWLDSIEIAPAQWPTSAVLDWHDVLKHAPTLPARQERLKEAEKVLWERLHLEGTRMGFSTEAGDGLSWLLASADENANRLLLAVLDEPSRREDIPRLVRGALGRQERGHWGTTLANAWGVLAMEKFGKAFESVPVQGTITATLGEAHKDLAWAKHPEGGGMFLPWPGQPGTLAVRHEGGGKGRGKPWLTVQSLAAIQRQAPINSGLHVTRTVSAVERKVKDAWSQGDVLRVRLEMEAEADSSWVVVKDPIPSGAALLGTGLQRDSAILTQGERREGEVWPTFEERTFDSYRAYYEFVPKGKWAVEYTVRLNNAGQFTLPVTRVEAMYAPEQFSELPNAEITVRP